MRKLAQKRDFDFVPRRKNLLALSKYGLTVYDAREILTELKSEDYYKGPKKDFTKPGEIWEFKRQINGTWFYIKLKIVDNAGYTVLKCIGFHEDEFSKDSMR